MELHLFAADGGHPLVLYGHAFHAVFGIVGVLFLHPETPRVGGNSFGAGDRAENLTGGIYSFFLLI